MASRTPSLTRWTWVWANSRSLWSIRKPGMLKFMGSQRIGHDWVTELIWNCVVEKTMARRVGEETSLQFGVWRGLQGRGVFGGSVGFSWENVPGGRILQIWGGGGACQRLKLECMCGNSLVVQWLELHALNAKGRVQSWVRELRSHKPFNAAGGKKKKEES